MKMINNQVAVNAGESKEKHTHLQPKVSAAGRRAASEWKAKVFYVVALCLLFASTAFGQGARFDSVAQKNVQGFLAPIPGATITICTSAATGTPCTPIVPTSPVTLCTDSTCAVAGTNPFPADSNGNWGFWALPGTYKVSITGTGVTGQLLTVTLPCAAGISCLANPTTAAVAINSPGSLSVTGATTLAAASVANLSSNQTATIANSPTGATESGSTVTITTTAPCTFTTGQSIVVAGVGVSGYNGQFTVNGAGCNGGSTFTYDNLNNPLAASGGGTVTGSVSHPNGITSLGPNTIRFNGLPWFDVTSSQFGAKCDGVTDDTTAIQNTLTAAKHVNQGVTVFSPPGQVCIIASSLSLNNLTGVQIIGGFGTNPFGGNTQSTWKFTGTCASGPCLVMNSGASTITFSNISLLFSGVTTAPAMDISASSNCSFHGVSFSGPSAASTITPLVLIGGAQTTTFDQGTTFNNAGVFVKGPPSNATVSDKTVFEHVTFENPTVAAMQNAAINWTVRESIYQMFQAGSTCTPFLQYVGGFTQWGNLLVEASEFNSTGGDCTNAFTLFTLPAPLNTNNGGAQFLSNLVITGTAAHSQTIWSIAGAAAPNNQVFVANSNTIANANVVLALSGSNTGVSFGPNIYQNVTTLVTGNIYQGTVIDNAGDYQFFVGGSSVSTTPSLIMSGLLGMRFATRCNPGSVVSPAACGASPSGTVVVPTTTTTYTVNTTAVTASSDITITPITDNSGLTGSPTCVAPPTPFIAYESGRVAGTSFTFTLPSTTGASCWSYWVRN